MKDDLSPAAKHIGRVFLDAIHDARDLKVEDLEPPSPGAKRIGRMFLDLWHAENVRFLSAQEAGEHKQQSLEEQRP